jgi:hypothetical protein
MGIVFRAMDLRLRRTVAIKVLPPELAFRADIRSRFLREAVAAAQLNHPSIVPIYSVDEHDGVVYFAMGYVDGENLAGIVERSGRLPHARVREIILQVADALAYAHEKGVVHRDIKPDNIIMAHDSGRAMVTDFGIARAMSDSASTRLTATGVAIGTPAYMSPEQCAGEQEIDGRSDLYSLGVVGYQMLAGHTPFQASSTPALLMKHFSEAPPDLASLGLDIPGDLADSIMRLLEKKPAERFSDGRELVNALTGAAVPRPRSARVKPASGERPVQEGGEQRGRKERRKIKFREKPLAERVRITRGDTAQWMGWVVFFAGINFFTSPHFPWFVFPALGIGIDVWEKVASLMAEGLRFGDIYGRGARAILAGGAPPVAGKSESTAAQLPEAGAGQPLPAAVADGELGATVRQAQANRRTIAAQVASLSPEDRQLIPEVEVVAGELLNRVVSLASALASLDSELDPAKIRVLDERVAAAEREGLAGAESERRLALLRKQQVSWRSLADSRAQIHARLDSAALMLQNLALDVLKLRSAGLQSVVSDVNSATQEARALIREIGHVVGAADEVRALESKQGESR